MSSTNDAMGAARSTATPTSQTEVKRIRAVYIPAVGPRLKKVLYLIFAALALLGATGVYLAAIRFLEWFRAQTYTNQFTLWMFVIHLLVGILITLPFLAFGITHWVQSRRRQNRIAIRWGLALFHMGAVVCLTGLALIQLEKFPQLPSGFLRNGVYTLHALAPCLAVVLYWLHRRAGPLIRWKWAYGWAGAVGLFVVGIGVFHSQDPRKWYSKGSPEGEKYFEPAATRTVDGKFVSDKALMMDDYCLKCHQDVYKGWFHSAHHFSSFNNPAYLFSVRETREVALKRDGSIRAARWCAGCHDPVPFLSGQFDDPHYDDVNHPTSQAGITCTVCHAMVHVNSRTGNGDYTIEEPQHYPWAYSDNNILQWVNNQLVKAKPDFHRKTFLKPFHRSEEFCSTCHKVSLPLALNHYKEFLRGQNHSDTFLLSGASGHGARSFYYPPKAKSRCAECHMPLSPSQDFGGKDFDGSGTRKIHDHLFPGANTALPWMLAREPAQTSHAEGFQTALQRQQEFLRGSDSEGKDKILRADLFGVKEGESIEGALIAPLRPELPALKPGKTYLIEVVLRTLKLGHPFTQGTADSNEVWVDFRARSGDKLIGRSGGMSEGEDRGSVDEWSHFVNVLMLDRQGNRVDRRNPQDIYTPLYDHQIAPGAAQVVHFRLVVPQDVADTVELSVRLRYRKFDRGYMEKVFGAGKVPHLPIVDICSDKVILPVAGTKSFPVQQTSPIKPEWERWNDYGIACLLEGGADAKKGELRQAEQAFRKLSSGADKAAQGQGFLNLARVYQAEGRLDEAAIALNKSLKAQPPAPWWTVAWFTGLVNAQNDHLDEAIANFEQILDPAHQPVDRGFDFSLDYIVRNQLGKTLFNRAQTEADDSAEKATLLNRTAEAFEKTLTIDPEDLDAHYGLFQCYSELGKNFSSGEARSNSVDKKSLEELAEALSQKKLGADSRWEAARVLVDALRAFENAKSDPNQPKLPVLQKLMKDIRIQFLEETDVRIRSAIAFLLGQLHRQAHAVYKPDDNAREIMAIYRKHHAAADHAAEAIVVYPLNRPGAPGSSP